MNLSDGRLDQSVFEVMQRGRAAFLYDESELSKSVQAVKELWQRVSLSPFELFFSVKTNPNPHLLLRLATLVSGFDVSSVDEALLLQRFGVGSERITWSGPAKTNRTLALIASQPYRAVHLDSIDELIALNEYETANRVRVPKTLRLGARGIAGLKLGFSDADLERLIETGIESFQGVHSYLGREAFSFAAIHEILERANHWADRGLLTRDYEFYLGAGLPAREVQNSVLAAPTSKPRRRLHLECGRALVQSCGVYLVPILAVTRVGDQMDLLVDGGLQHLGSHFRSPHYGVRGVSARFFRAGKSLSVDYMTCRIRSSFSGWNDFLLEVAQAPLELKRGDWIAITNAGAYGVTAAPHQVMGLRQPSEWLVPIDGPLADISPQSELSASSPHQESP